MSLLFFQKNPESSVREAAVETGIPESSVHRHKKTIERRDLQPESYMRETEEGRRWILLLICATLYIFGIRCGVGMGTVSEFFKCLRLEKHPGISPTNLYRMVSKIEDAILEYKAEHEKNEGIAAPAVAGADETFFNHMNLVMVELSSGYILLEEPAEDRTYNRRPENIGTESWIYGQ